MEFYKNGLALRREMRKWLSSDFGSKPRLKDLQIVEYNISDEDKATIQEILDRNEINHSKAFQRKEPEWNIDEEKKYLKKQVRNMMKSEDCLGCKYETRDIEDNPCNLCDSLFG